MVPNQSIAKGSIVLFRVYTEKKRGFDQAADRLAEQLRTLPGVQGLTGLRMINRYDLEGIDEDLFKRCLPTVFAQPQTDLVATRLEEALRMKGSENLPPLDSPMLFAVAPLPGQFDQRADSAAQCVQLVGQGARPLVATATVYLLQGELDAGQIKAIRNYLVNPVDSRVVGLEQPKTLAMPDEDPDPVPVLEGFRDLGDSELKALIDKLDLAMDLPDIRFCQDHYRQEKRDPTLTELKVIDTYWSDHCRHTTFNTRLERIEADNPQARSTLEQYRAIREELGRQDRPECLMDMATIGARYLQKQGILNDMDQSEEVNACTIRTKVDVDGQDQDWLFLFKNETHNHPTEIEPFGGAATCIGGAIRDPLSGRGYVYQAMRVSGAADPRQPLDQTLPGKLPQSRIVRQAADGYSSYGNQIGLATGQVREIYHPGYAAKRMEVGAVVAATPADHVIRRRPAPGDLIILVGGRTGRDGIGGATGASKSQDEQSLERCGAEVQKGDAPEERKLQRLFRRPEAARLIERCNDFGAGGVAVAVGELADGLNVDLDRVPLKYQGLDGTEIAISESQERMAVALAAEDAPAFIDYARQEDLEATVIAEVTEEPQLRMTWRSETIVDIPRSFLASNGAPHKADAQVAVPAPYHAPFEVQGNLDARMKALLTDINVCSQQGLAEQFDSTIGAGTVLMPFGGARQLTPAQAMVAKLPVDGHTTTASAMAWGFNPWISSQDPYTGAYLAVVESLAKLVASGFSRSQAHLSLQEYYPKPGDDPRRWGLPVAGVLGALQAQLDLSVGAIGGKDSMSGSFEDLDVPPTLISFAVALGRAKNAVSPEFKAADRQIYLLTPEYQEEGLLPDPESLRTVMDQAEALISQGLVDAAATPGYGCIAQNLLEMCLGNRIGLDLASDTAIPALFRPAYGSFILETSGPEPLYIHNSGLHLRLLGHTREDYRLRCGSESLDLAELEEIRAEGLESIFPYRGQGDPVPTIGRTDREPGRPAARKTKGPAKTARPRVVMPVFPGTNCEFDSARAFRDAGAQVDTVVIRNLNAQDVAESSRRLAQAIRSSQILMLPGGFSGGDEPDGSAKLVASFLRSHQVADALQELLHDRDGLVLGVCNGFQALIKLGLVPYGKIVTGSPEDPTLAVNTIGRHQSRLVHTRISSTRSPWLSACRVGDIHTMPISHGEGRFVAEPGLLRTLIDRGQVAAQYVDEQGRPSMNPLINPNGSDMAVEAITSPDGRVLGKMGHTERSGPDLYLNVPGKHTQPLFQSGVDYFAA
nr:phosphoribosylformylglycinamidine synthase [Bifidobacterium asteroides]